MSPEFNSTIEVPRTEYIRRCRGTRTRPASTLPRGSCPPVLVNLEEGRWSVDQTFDCASGYVLILSVMPWLHDYDS